jgi:hypothetical protein
MQVLPVSEPCNDAGGGTYPQMRDTLAFPVLDPLETVRQKTEVNCLWKIPQLKISVPLLDQSEKRKLCNESWCQPERKNCHERCISPFELTTCYSLQNVILYQCSKSVPEKIKACILRKDEYVKTCKYKYIKKCYH